MGWNRLRVAALIPVVLAVGAMSASAATILVTFDSDPVGNISGNDFTSNDSTQIHFSDTVSPGGNEMFIVPESLSDNALLVAFDDDDSALSIDFGGLFATSIGMDTLVGSSFTPDAGDVAMLTAYQGAVVVGSVSVALGSPLAFDGAVFDRVEVEFVVPGGLSEIVDNVSVTVIPEPHAAVVFGAGALLVGAACGRRSRAGVGLRARRC